jgi:hypothetical protein
MPLPVILGIPGGAVAQLGERLNGIQEVASSILVSSTTEITPFPLVFEHTTGFLIFTPLTFFSASFNRFCDNTVTREQIYLRKGSIVLRIQRSEVRILLGTPEIGTRGLTRDG